MYMGCIGQFQDEVCRSLQKYAFKIWLRKHLENMIKVCRITVLYLLVHACTCTWCTLIFVLIHHMYIQL